MENEELAKLIYSGQHELTEKLYNQNKAYIYACAKRYYINRQERLIKCGAEFEDLISELAEKYNVSLQSVSKHGNAGKWGELRKKQLNKISTEVVQKTAEKIVEYEVDRISHIMHMCDKLTKEIDKAIEQLDKVIVNGEVVNVGLIDTYKLRQLVQSLKDVKDIVKTYTSERDLKQLDTVIEHIKGNI